MGRPATSSIPVYYDHQNGVVRLAAGIVDLGFQLPLGYVNPANVTTGTIRGSVTDTATGQGLGGVTVTVSTVPAAVETDANGDFQISNVPTGPLSIQAEKSGYSSAAGSADMTAGGLLVFSPALTPVTAPITAIPGEVDFSRHLLYGPPPWATQQKLIESTFENHSVVGNVNELQPIAIHRTP